MRIVYKLNSDELNNDVITAIKSLFPHKKIEIIVQESGRNIQNTTHHHETPEYLTMSVDEIVIPTRDDRYEC